MAYFDPITQNGTNAGLFFFFLKGRKKDFGKVMGVFLRMIGPLAEAI
jgi:hypothetical protein